MTNALKDIEKLVAEVAEEALSSGTSLDQKMDALKLLQPYYAVLKKAKNRSDDDSSDDQPTMGEMRERLRDVEGPADGGVKTADRRARNGS